jgi:putative transposase
VRVAEQISHAFGVVIDKDVVRRVLEKHFRPDGFNGPSWLTFIAQTKDSLWSLDLFRCESILLRSHWLMVVMDVFTRRIVGFAVEPGPVDGLSVCRMIQSATATQPLPQCVSTDHDPLFRFHRWRAPRRPPQTAPLVARSKCSIMMSGNLAKPVKLLSSETASSSGGHQP